MEMIKLPALCVACGAEYLEPIIPSENQLTDEDERLCEECEHRAYLFPLIN